LSRPEIILGTIKKCEVDMRTRANKQSRFHCEQLDHGSGWAAGPVG